MFLFISALVVLLHGTLYNRTTKCINFLSAGPSIVLKGVIILDNPSYYCSCVTCLEPPSATKSKDHFS